MSMRALAIGGLLIFAAACARDGSAQSLSAMVRDDTAAVSRFLTAVRGADPLLCELAARNVDMHGWWSRFGPMVDNPLDVDSSSAVLVAWVQRGNKNPILVPRLRTAMRDTDACVRRVAASFLGRIDHPTAIAALVAALDDASADTRHVAAIGLGLADDKSVGGGAVESLMRRLRDDSPRVRRSAAWALGSLEARIALLPLIEMLERDSDPRVRQTAAWALGQISD